MRTIAHTFSTYSEATSVVNALESAGIPHSDISIVSGDKTANVGGAGNTATGMTSGDPAQGASTGAGTGATLGTVLGGGAGLLAGLGSLAIPGIGPIVAAGWLVAALTGAGVSEADAQTYQQRVNEGGTLVTARVDDSQAAQVEQIMSMGSGTTGSTMTRPSSYAAPDAPMGTTAVPGSTATGLGAGTTAETTAQRDIDTGLPR